MDALSTILQSVRLDGALLSRAALSTPFSVESPGMNDTIFHAVVDGSCWIHLPDAGCSAPLAAGDVAIVAKGQRHIIASPSDRSPVPIATLGTSASPSGIPLLAFGSSKTPTRILCGTVRLEHPAADGFVELLPKLVALEAEGAQADWLRSTLRLLESELDAGAPGTEAITTRLVDLLIALAIRRASALEDHPKHGWFAAACDPQIGRALALIHSDPARDWTAANLATEVGLSRTQLFESWSRLVGDTPARYLARWRVHCAADLLRDRSLSLIEIAERVGYASEDSLSRAFKRIMGTSASAYRRSTETH